MMQARNFVRAIVLALIAAACGGAAARSPGSAQATVSVRQVMGVGSVYTDSQGRSLYSPMQEASGKTSSAVNTSVLPISRMLIRISSPVGCEAASLSRGALRPNLISS